MIIKSTCNCGEPINVETDSETACRADKKRPFYEEHGATSTQLRCRKCLGWLADTCKDAVWEKVAA